MLGMRTRDEGILQSKFVTRWSFHKFSPIPFVSKILTLFLSLAVLFPHPCPRPVPAFRASSRPQRSEFVQPHSEGRCIAGSLHGDSPISLAGAGRREQ